ncbi:MAG: DJ-1/PfpI family protein [Dehalococcoidia bacterium]
MSFNIAFVLFPDFEELDYAGPFEVLGATAKHIDPEWQAYTVGEERLVRGTNGMTVQVDYLFDEAPKADLILVPGGQGTRTGVDNEALIGYIRKAGESAQYVTSVCTGSFLLQKAGFLEGKRATTHWGSRDELAKTGDVSVVAERWVHDGNVITAAGVSAGIDMALYLLGMLKTPDIARTLQHHIEYDPAPPYADAKVLGVPA